MKILEHNRLKPTFIRTMQFFTEEFFTYRTVPLMNQKLQMVPPGKKVTLKRTNIFNTYFGVSAAIKKAFCLGKKSSKPRLLKVSIGNVQHNLKNKLNFRSSNNPPHMCNISLRLTLPHLNKSRTRDCIKSWPI